MVMIADSLHYFSSFTYSSPVGGISPIRSLQSKRGRWVSRRIARSCSTQKHLVVGSRHFSRHLCVRSLAGRDVLVWHRLEVYEMGLRAVDLVLRVGTRRAS